ncbi:Stp1/IreP family PP2C-type Ser/Thr phosphatase [Actimicrobium sp. CCI2.3]|uniref:Stp1/IreP family PP2C-type Ser/Thr phosphatase n=1 Tax=Actimicrobium sp. CCI2.3 TaxID=3048616 RepID=UPI002AB5D8FE|nr:Stp1/IreP family PP2C-type Ser/Thr phosphatase [Actimicrobium sp. CCI2.3]MDY7576082.1 Stp1/IreP family PP2C-type Ser/Thr phosphatase [Actimicrobium sp. CCI2.3]MEB0023012.1 Stp1/IreP family PP2C-type Ser/Thr phosphatase [Actimicrobium sp. CCI2.3]
MSIPLQLEFAALTDTGLLRPHNEDAIAISPDFGLVILADGMGGYNAGEVASNMAITIVRQVMETELQAIASELAVDASDHLPALLSHAVNEANTAILTAALLEPEYTGMGTTLVMALFHHETMTLAHVGDSRCYRQRDGQLEQLTRDHSFVQEQLDAGLVSADEAWLSPNRNLITRAVGVDDVIEVEVHDVAVLPGDLYLLCSDGLSDMLTAQHIEAILQDSTEDLQLAAANLLASANEQGGLDNISVILVYVQDHEAQKNGLIDRLLGWIK